MPIPQSKPDPFPIKSLVVRFLAVDTPATYLHDRH